MDPEYVTGQINSCILELKILICFSLKCFPNNYKRYSSHLQVLILHQVAPTKVYLSLNFVHPPPTPTSSPFPVTFNLPNSLFFLLFCLLYCFFG